MAFGKGSPDIIHKNRHGTIRTSYWMRVLEERYQRLHAKVISGTARFSTNKNLNYTAKRPPARCWKEYKQINNRRDAHAQAMANDKESKQKNTVEKATYERCHQKEWPVISSSELSANPTPNRPLKSLLTLNPDDSSVNENHRLTDNTRVHQESKSPDVQMSKSGGLQNSDASDEPSAPPSHDIVEDCLSVNSSSQCSFDVSLGASDNLLYHPDSGKHKENSDKNYNEKRREVNTGTDTDNSRCNSGKLKYYNNMKHTEDKRSSRRRRIQKGKDAWACSTIQKTNTEFPENRAPNENGIKSKHLRSVNNNRARRTVDSIDSYGAMQQQKSRGMNERLFARMSVEAQRAVDETLKDMKGCRVDATIQGEHRNNRNYNPVYKHSSHARVERTKGHATNSTNRISDKTEDPSTQQGNADKLSAGSMLPRSTITQEDLPNCNSFQYSTNYSNQKKSSMPNHFLTNQEPAAVKVTQAEEEPNHKLPILEHKIAQPTQIMTSNHVNLPGIWNRRDALSFREKTFEITPLNFDIRFHQIIPHHMEDRETPSPDIQQQAIEKCHQWLVRYMSIN